MQNCWMMFLGLPNKYNIIQLCGGMELSEFACMASMLLNASWMNFGAAYSVSAIRFECVMLFTTENKEMMENV